MNDLKPDSIARDWLEDSPMTRELGRARSSTTLAWAMDRFGSRETQST